MDRHLTLLFMVIFGVGCHVSKPLEKNKMSHKNFVEISSQMSCVEFEQIKNFVLTKGDRKFYRNFDSNNPHYQLKDFDVYLGADIGQRNVNNDPAISDFNQLTIYDVKSDIKYYELVIVRKGDLKADKAWIRAGMKEEEVYLVDVYDRGLDLMKANLPHYLQQIREAMKASQ